MIDETKFAELSAQGHAMTMEGASPAITVLLYMKIPLFGITP
jgi:hypothetical protein